MKKLVISLCTLTAFLSSGQILQIANPGPLQQVQSQNQIPQRTCGTAVLPQQYEDWVQTLASSNPKGGGSNNTQSIFNIPVIVHVIHNNEAVNSVAATTGGNLNAAQIIDQINILNKDFNGTNADTNLIPAVFKPLLGKFQINFCLAVVNPTGGVLAEPGINRVNRNTMGWSAPPYSQAYVNSTIKPATIWDVNRYMNMWVMQLGGGLLGFATFPNPGTTGLLGIPAPYGGPTSDGVVMLNTAFGSIGTAANYVPYNKGRTTTHEVGHWLGLRHIWGDAACGNDYCNDTPTQQAQNFNCPAFPKISCSNGPNGEMHMNFMDYTNDACMYMFTKDQKNRAQLIMTGSAIRANLLTSTVCNLPSVGHDIGITYVTSPTYSQVINCSNKISPVINLRNWGTTNLTSATIYYNCDGVNTQTVTWTGSLSPSVAVNYTLPQIINLTNGAHAFNATVTAPNSGTDNNNSNNVNNQLFYIANSFTMSANSASICASQNATLTATGGASSYTWNPGNIAGSSAVVSPTTTTIYTLSGSSGTCINTFTTTVTVNGSLNIGVTSATICAGGSTILTASGATSYTWNTGPFTPTISVSPAVTTVYTVSGTNGSCSGSKTTTVTVNPNPTVTVNSATICSGNTVTLSALGATTYSWSTSSTASSITVSPMSTTVYTVNGYNGNCVNTKTAQVAVNTTPTVSVNNASICSGSSVALNATGATSYTWSTSQISSSIAVSPISTSVYTVTGTSNNCINVKTATVSVTTTPTVTVNSATICSGNSATLIANGAITYSWNTSATSMSITVNPVSTAVYSVTGYNGVCVNTKTSQVNVNITPTVSVNSPSICSGNSVALSATGANTYSWSSSQTTSSILVSPVSTAFYTVTGTSNGCSNIKTATVTVNATPTVNVNSFTICPGGSATLTASGANTYLWNNGPTTNSNVVSPVSTTVYSVTGTSNGCSSVKTATVTIGSGLSVIVSPNSQTICSGNSATITASGATSYTWSNASTGNSIVVSPSALSVYSVVGVSGACTGTTNASIAVNPNPTVTVNSSTICSGNSATLNATGANSYSWSNGPVTPINTISPGLTTVYTVTGTSSGCTNVKTATVTVNPNPTVTVNSATVCAGNPGVLNASGAASYSWSNGPTTSSVLVNPTLTTVYTVTGTSAGCINVKTTTVTVSAAATLSLNLTNVPCFAMSTGAATINASGGAAPYTYSFSNGPTTQTTASLAAGSYTATVSTSFGCVSTATFTITQPPPINAIANSTNATCASCNNGVANVMVIGGTAPYTYTWMPASGNASIATNLFSGCYTVSILDANNCSASQTVCVGEDTNGSTGLINITKTQNGSLVFPNPTNGIVTIVYTPGGSHSVELYDMFGKLIVQTETDLTTGELDLQDLAAGVYYLRISNGRNTDVVRLVKY